MWLAPYHPKIFETMKLARQTNGTMNLVEVEDGHEVGGDRTEEQLYLEGYKKACEYHGEAQETEWVEYPTCWVEVEVVDIEETMEEQENG